MEITDKKKQGLRNIVITFVNMHWENHSIDEAIWDRQAEMEEKYPLLFNSEGEMNFEDKFIFYTRVIVSVI